MNALAALMAWTMLRPMRKKQILASVEESR